ncbi:MAG: hypothetical protein ABI612_10050 [Betaproteobacteria bacterium]
MRKLFAMVLAVMLGLSVAGISLAAEKEKPNSDTSTPRAQPPEGSAATTSTPGGDLTEKEQAYLSDLKKCENLGDAEKRRCVDQLRNEHGQN